MGILYQSAAYLHDIFPISSKINTLLHHNHRSLQLANLSETATSHEKLQIIQGSSMLSRRHVGS
jgi:hypothetical protein